MSEHKSSVSSIKQEEQDQLSSDNEDQTQSAANMPLKPESTDEKRIVQLNYGRPRKHPYKPGKYKCETCDIMCSKPSALEKHIRTHTNERPYPCSLCKRSFKTKSNLTKHEKSKSHSSKIEFENQIPERPQSNKEKAAILLRALQGNGPEFNPHSNVEYDCPSKTQSDNSESVCEDDSESSDDDSIPIKRESDDSHLFKENMNKSSDDGNKCSGTLTINSQEGPITVEVQLNLDTMRQLKQGLSSIIGQRSSSPTFPLSSVSYRNDAELRAAESILHMANQRPHIDHNIPASMLTYDQKPTVKDDFKKKLTTAKKPSSLTLPCNAENSASFSKPSTPTPTTLSRNASPKDFTMSKSRLLEAVDGDSGKVSSRRLVKENLLKKMQKKQALESKDGVQTSPDSANSFNNFPMNAVVAKNGIEETIRNSIQRPTNITLSNIRNSNGSSTSPIVAINTPTNIKQGIMLQNSKIITPTTPNRTTASCNPTILLITPVSTQKPVTVTTAPLVKDATILQQLSTSDIKIDSSTSVLSRVISNTQSLHNHQGKSSAFESNNPVSPVKDMSENSVIPMVNVSEQSPESGMQTDVPATETDSPQESAEEASSPLTITTTEAPAPDNDSETESSPRLHIVEYPSGQVPLQRQRSSTTDDKEEDEEEDIDVVNTDSDDDTALLQRHPAHSRPHLARAWNKRKGCRESTGEQQHSSIKRIKEAEKIMPLHAPNINAKDLLQDCPLNLSANRQPTIPPALSGTYRQQPGPVDPVHIAALTNTNPAHTQQPAAPSAAVATAATPGVDNGRIRSYPYFEDRVRCEVCSQSIDPSMRKVHMDFHIYTDGRENTQTDRAASPHGGKPRSYKCVVCNIAFRVVGHLRKHHKSKSHLQGLVNSGLLSKALNAKIEQCRVPIHEVIDQKTGNIIPDVLSRYISNWMQPESD